MSKNTLPRKSVSPCGESIEAIAEQLWDTINNAIPVVIPAIDRDVLHADTKRIGRRFRESVETNDVGVITGMMYGSRYYYIDSLDAVQAAVWNGLNDDRRRAAAGNIYMTQGIATVAANALRNLRYSLRETIHQLIQRR